MIINTHLEEEHFRGLGDRHCGTRWNILGRISARTDKDKVEVTLTSRHRFMSFSFPRETVSSWWLESFASHQFIFRRHCGD